MKERLQVGDIVQIINPVLSETHSYYRVISIDGNRARTYFRVFNARIWHGGYVYEFGKRLSSIYNNSYKVVSGDLLTIDRTKPKVLSCRCIYCTEIQDNQPQTKG